MAAMAKQAGFWSFEEISADGDAIERLNAVVNFEPFQPILESTAGRLGSPKGGRLGRDAVLTFRMLVLQTLHGLSLKATENIVRDRLSWIRFCGLGVAATVPDASTPWDFREVQVKANALDALCDDLGCAINQAGFIPRTEQIVDASFIDAPRSATTMAKRRNTARWCAATGRLDPDRPIPDTAFRRLAARLVPDRPKGLERAKVAKIPNICERLMLC